MASTPIYNWPTPDNTGLVKNGALDMRTLGNAIDTTMATMTPKSLVDAKGDLISATANDTPARLAVGANDYFLQAASGESTGLKWGGAYTTFTPAFSGGSAFTLGNGTATGRYIKIGKMVNVNVQLVLGSTTVMPSNFTRIDAPIAGLATVPPAIGSAYYYDQSADTLYAGPLGWFQSSGLQFLLWAQTTNANCNLVQSANPFTWAANDVLSVSMTYEVA